MGKRVRKTVDEFCIMGNYGYGHGWEEVTSEDTRKLGLEQLKCYRENEPGVPFKMIKKRVKIPVAGVV